MLICMAGFRERELIQGAVQISLPSDSLVHLLSIDINSLANVLRGMTIIVTSTVHMRELLRGAMQSTKAVEQLLCLHGTPFPHSHTAIDGQ